MRRTNEQQVATQELTAAAPGYRVKPDAEGWPTASGKYGRLEHLGAAPDQPGQLAAFTTSGRIFAKLAALPGVRRHQTGDAEFRVFLAPSAVQVVARLLRCYRRRSAPTNGFRKAITAHPAATSRPQELRSLAEAVVQP